MGRSGRHRPKRLATKLLQIRKGLGLSQNEMLQRMGLQGDVLREEVSDFERNRRVPPLIVLLHYARAAKVTVDVLIDDAVDLPSRSTETVGEKPSPRSRKKAVKR